MNIFFVTDNKIWFDFLHEWSNESLVDTSIFCSPTGAGFFVDEIERGLISTIDLKLESIQLVEKFDMGFSCHCKQIFPKFLVEGVPCFNFHPGFNPENRGWFPQVFSIINGKPVGATLHKMDCEIDHGPIIERIRVEINNWDTSKSVYDRILNEEFKLFEKWIDRILTGDHDETHLGLAGNYNSITDFKNICEINLNKKVTFKEAIDYLRAMTFDGYDNAFFKTGDGQKVYVSINLRLSE